MKKDKNIVSSTVGRRKIVVRNPETGEVINTLIHDEARFGDQAIPAELYSEMLEEYFGIKEDVITADDE